MTTVEKSIDVAVPVRTVYNQWTQFEEFPMFMEGVERIEQLDDQNLHWVATIAGVRREWDARIVEQIPDKRIAWRSESGAPNAGVVNFQELGDGTTRVMLHIEYDPESMTEKVGDMMGFVSRRVEGDLERFKEFIESRGRETGAWRGEIDETQAEGGGGERPLM